MEPSRDQGERMPERWMVLVDFDGTLTERDADFLVADALLPEPMAGAYMPLARAYERLELDTAGYFAGYLELLGRDPEDLARVARGIPLREGARELFQWLDESAVASKIVSEGLDVYIAPALEASGLGHVPLSCNRWVAPYSEHRVVGAPDASPCDRCLSCKGTHVRRAKAQGYRVAVVGNGASDLCAAREADLVLARDSLAEHLRAEGRAFVPWATMADVRGALERVVDSNEP